MFHVLLRFVLSISQPSPIFQQPAQIHNKTNPTQRNLDPTVWHIYQHRDLSESAVESDDDHEADRARVKFRGSNDNTPQKEGEAFVSP